MILISALTAVQKWTEVIAMIKFNGSISFIVTQRCKICGKTYEGDSDVVMRKSIVHLIFRHPKEFAKAIIKHFKNRRHKQ